MKRHWNLRLLVLIIILTFSAGGFLLYLELFHNSYSSLSKPILSFSSNFQLNLQPVNSNYPIHAADKIFVADNIEPSKGVFLIASPNLIDPNFSKAVVLLIEYSENGAVGLIINRPSDVKLKEIIPELRGLSLRNKKVHIGGPVSIYQLFFMIMTKSKLKDAYNVFDNVYLIQDINRTRKILTKKAIKNQLRIYAGYAGWAPGQLDYEISRGDWFLIKADVKSIFFKSSDEIWPELIKKSSAQWV